MSSWDEATAWLNKNASDWRIARSATSIVAGPFVGSPTEQRVQVLLVPENSPAASWIELSGEGQTILEAVQRAIGAYAGGAA